MPTECTPKRFEFEAVGRRAVVACFDGGDITSNAGALLLGQVDRGLGLMRRFAACFTDRRDPRFVEHQVETLVGQTPIEYCRAVRIARARELLEGGDTSRKQIAQSLGYKDVASFARVFRKAVGSAPGTYRKRFRRNGISPTHFAAKDGSRRKKNTWELSHEDRLTHE
jgi:hypothetical protein